MTDLVEALTVALHDAECPDRRCDPTAMGMYRRLAEQLVPHLGRIRAAADSGSDPDEVTIARKEWVPTMRKMADPIAPLRRHYHEMFAELTATAQEQGLEIGSITLHLTMSAPVLGRATPDAGAETEAATTEENA